MTMQAIDYQALIESAAEVCGLEPGEISGRSRRNEAVFARFYVWAVAMEKFGYSASDIGRAFGRDHSTILHGLDRLRKFAEGDSVHRSRVEEVFALAADWCGNPPKQRKKISESCYSIPDRNDLAMIKAKADAAERALIALLRLDYAAREIELPRRSIVA